MADIVIIIFILPKGLSCSSQKQIRKACGLSVEAYIQKCLSLSAQTLVEPARRSAEEANRLIDEAADVILAGVPPLPAETMSRESIYSRQDEW